jgi:tRNA1Val (adenine37-N6)-methyltransferase
MERAVEVTTLFRGSLVLRQPRRGEGYRVNVDALLLAAFASGRLDDKTRSHRHAVDLGSGVGAIGFALVHFGGARRVSMIETDRTLADLARENAAVNGWSDRVEVVCTDVRKADVRGDLVVCNPPYVAPGRGRAPKESTRAARYGELDAFVEAARRCAGRRARIAFVYPVTELSGFLALLRGSGLEPKRIRFVHPRAAEPARIALVESAAGRAGGLVVEPPFFEREGRGPSASLDALLTTPAS